MQDILGITFHKSDNKYHSKRCSTNEGIIPETSSDQYLNCALLPKDSSHFILNVECDTAPYYFYLTKNPVEKTSGCFTKRISKAP